jgi:DNA-binding CsgD family transcriptional regulator
MSKRRDHDGVAALSPPAGLLASLFSAGADEFVVLEWMLRPSELPPGLSAAELEVARLAVDGCSNHEIAALRRTSTRTVANQMASIFRKLGVGSRHELMTRAGAGWAQGEPRAAAG